MKSIRAFFTLRKEEEQSGINMVDLMMWLVIAALLLASAIQGIGYYQQNANVYQMRSAVDVAASRVMALAANDGSVDIDDVDTVVAEENAARTNDSVTLTVDTIALTAAGEQGDSGAGFELASVTTATTVASGETFYIRATHEGVSGYDVIYLFNDIASQKAGIHLVGKGGTQHGNGNNGNGNGNTPSPSATATPTPSATATPSPSASATPTPTPTPAPTPAPTPPADYNAPTATIAAGSNEHLSPKFYGKSLTAGGTGSAYAGFRLLQVSSSSGVSGFKVEWTGYGLEAANAVLPAAQTGTYGTEPQWLQNVTAGSGGFKVGSFQVTAKVTNLTSGEVSTRTWAYTVIPTAAQAPKAGYGPAWFADRNTTALTSATVPFRFALPNSTAGDFTVTWTTDGGANLKATQTGTAWLDGDMLYHAEIAPVDGGYFTAGTGKITASIKHNASGAVTTKVFTLTATNPVLADATASGWSANPRNVPRTSGNFVIGGVKIAGAQQADYTVTYSGGSSLNVSSVASSWEGANYASTWVGVGIPGAGGLTPGTAVVTVTAVHKATGTVLTRNFTLNVT
jgi:hypothetical protein